MSEEGIVPPVIHADPYPKVPEPDRKPSMTVYCRVVFHDTGTVKDITPTHFKPGDLFQIRFDRTLNGRDFEPRQPIQYVVLVDPQT